PALAQRQTERRGRSPRRAARAGPLMDAPRRARTPFDAPLRAWFAAQQWTPAPFQREVWRRYLRGESGLLVTPTGSGKTLAVFGGPLLNALREKKARRREAG